MCLKAITRSIRVALSFSVLLLSAGNIMALTTENNSTTAISELTMSVKADQTIGAISLTPTALAVGGRVTLKATATSGLPVRFSSTTSSICTTGGTNGTTLTGIAAGTCTVIAKQAGNTSFNAAPQVTRNITIGKASQTIGAISLTPTTLAVGGTTALTATASSGLLVRFSSTTPTICTTNGSTLRGVTIGVCTIAAKQPGNANYKAAPQVTRDVTIGKGNQTIGAISFTPSTLVIGGTTTASATATSGLSVRFSSTTSSVCTTGGTNGSVITGVAVGTCTIAAKQPGNTNYKAAPQVTKNITVNSLTTPIPIISSNMQLIAGEAYSSKEAIQATGQVGEGIVTSSVSSKTWTVRAGIVNIVNIVLDHLFQDGRTNKQFKGATPSSVVYGPMTLPCATSGSITMTINKATPFTYSVGDSVNVTFNSCQQTDSTSPVVNGEMSLVFTSFSSTSMGLNVQTSNLSIRNIPDWPASDSFTINGGVAMTIVLSNTSEDVQSHTASLQVVYQGSKPETASITNSDLHVTTSSTNLRVG
ncbi:exported hypothetical protein [Gammaproteobacteria bacterium]